MKLTLFVLALAVAAAYRLSGGSKWHTDCRPVGADPDSDKPEDLLKSVGPNLAQNLGAPTPEDPFAVPEQQVTGEVPHDDSSAA
jgi:hypothetical protein